MAEKLVKNMAKFERLTQKDFQRGFSLIEVLVALVILVIGLIGIFNLHIVAKRGSFESFQETQASYLANDMINRMKLNSTQLAAYAGTYKGAETSPSLNCIGGDLCTPAQAVKWDRYEWEQSLFGAAEVVGSKKVGGLEAPVACITIATNTVNVIVTWRGIRATSDGIGSLSCGSATVDKRRRVFSIKTVII
ncbi:type IV pilus modification protein PilV [Shewanella baltica]|uniref:type IV pilus modification protein PilV n=1 Tax=Shewanella baltica TaxID=62322 RepID=UPI0007B45C93|nr:type IV pilus modification protein PilV [Shewanella baltica]KZK69251.1 type IV pilus modification protein PilV [Shewanella baltica]